MISDCWASDPAQTRPEALAAEAIVIDSAGAHMDATGTDNLNSDRFHAAGTQLLGQGLALAVAWCHAGESSSLFVLVIAI